MSLKIRSVVPSTTYWSRFAIGDEVRVRTYDDRVGTVSGVHFTEGKVHYDVRMLNASSREMNIVVDSCDVEPSFG